MGGQDHELRVHRNWIGLLQPVGLVVSAPALVAAQAFPDKNVARERQALLSLVTPPPPKDARKARAEAAPLPVDFAALATQILGWKASKLVPAEALPGSLSLVLPGFGETLRPTYAVPAPPEHGQQPKGATGEWLLLVVEIPDGTPFDEPPPNEEGRRWHASPQARLERLLRETGVGIGLLANRRQVRLTYAPSGESSGHITWPIHKLTAALDRDMLSSLCMLLGPARLFTLPREQRLPHILRESRKYQNVVSTKLAGQVLEALNELLRGFQAANELRSGTLLDQAVREEPDHVYGGLLAVILRLVFILYAEERGLLSSSPVYVRNYSLAGLFEKLLADEGRFPDTMDQRYGAWARLLVLFRMVHDGARRGDLRLPPRYGHLFDPDAWGFIEGRGSGVRRVMGARVDVPKVADGVLLRVLKKLLLLEGERDSSSERLSYRALDVEQIGSVYENMMGFRLERATETSIGVGKQHVVIGLETLLGKKGAERAKYLEATAEVELSGKSAVALKAAASVDDLAAALGKRLSPLTPRPVSVGGLYLQPTDERRRSGSHYTPRELTEPIVRTALRPILEGLGATPRPEQILALKVCDPAMGSGAFLVEACRQLGTALVKSYDLHGRPTDLQPHEDIQIYAQRQVAQHCLYGVDKNQFAVDLGKLSLWLATLARDHAFTFLDHAIRHGDSLVGLSREQIASFHWAPTKQIPLIRTLVDEAIAEALALRAKIPELASSDDVREKQRLLEAADAALEKVRFIGDAAVASYFAEDKDKAREESRARWETNVLQWLSGGSVLEVQGLVNGLRDGDKPLRCFHWEIELPEVFARGGFDAFVGNPPFMGGSLVSEALGKTYHAFLLATCSDYHGKADFVGLFFRSCFSLLSPQGTLGFIATKSIRQGETRKSSLGWILDHGGQIYGAIRRHVWPGRAAVVISMVWITRSTHHYHLSFLDDRPVQRLTRFLLADGPDREPFPLIANSKIAFSGVNMNGKGFVLSETERAVIEHIAPAEMERVLPYLGGEELNDSPTLRTERYAIHLDDLDEAAAKRYPTLFQHLYSTVRLQRQDSSEARLREHWWCYSRPASDLYEALATTDKVIASSRHSPYLSFAITSARQIFSDALTLFVAPPFALLAILQSQAHVEWAILLGSSIKDDPRYIPKDCFGTMPLPDGWASSESLAQAGEKYSSYRATLMSRTNSGLTAISSRLHDPEDSSEDIVVLRELQAALDRAVLDAYEWGDIAPCYDFILEHAVDDEESESRIRRKRKPWRFRWPDHVRDKVLARLLILNAQRAKNETERSRAGKGKSSPATNRRGRKNKDTEAKKQGTLFEADGSG